MEQVKGCKKCKEKSIGKSSLPFVLLGLYFFVAATYGTYVFIQRIIDIFK